MAFEATKREWGELYAFFRLLADGYVYAGTPDVKRNEVQKLPVAMVQREEHDGTRRYILEDEATVRICGEKIDKQIPREDFAAVAELVFAAVKESSVGRFLRSFPFGNYVPVVGWRAYRQFEV